MFGAIGIRMTLGATRTSVLTQFLTKALMISFIGVVPPVRVSRKYPIEALGYGWFKAAGFVTVVYVR